jgi:FkbM family methyltransferase
VIVQRALLSLLEAGLLRGAMKRLAQRQIWHVQSGEAAGLKLVMPQNLDFVRGSTEPPMQRCVASHLGPGDVFYDIGANVGFFSLLAMTRVGSAGAAYAFEPVHENAATIRQNARLNHFGALSVFELAIDDGSRRAPLFVTAWDGGSSLSKVAVPPTAALEQRSVEVVSLDALIDRERLRPPTLVKIDVEGAELGVLRGMVKTIERFKPVLVYEVDDGDETNFQRRWQELDAVVAALGYHITHLEDSYANTHWFVGHSLAVPNPVPRH